VSGVLQDVGLWALGRGMELRTMTGSVMLMGVGSTLELAFERLTGRHVGGCVVGVDHGVDYLLGHVDD
jgi:hypothetical protein